MQECLIDRILISEEEIKSIVAKLGDEISEHYKGMDSEILVVGLLRGSFIFMADLVRQIKHPVRTEFMSISSYGDSSVSSGSISVQLDLDLDISGRDILLVEDIIDTGITLKNVVKMLKDRNPTSVKICTFLNKPSRRLIDVEIDFCGKDIPDEFVCGYGLDYAQKFRYLPHVACLKFLD